MNIEITKEITKCLVELAKTGGFYTLLVFLVWHILPLIIKWSGVLILANMLFKWINKQSEDISRKK